jgi:hypothetical protein
VVGNRSRKPGRGQPRGFDSFTLRSKKWGYRLGHRRLVANPRVTTPHTVSALRLAPDTTLAAARREPSQVQQDGHHAGPEHTNRHHGDSKVPVRLFPEQSHPKTSQPMKNPMHSAMNATTTRSGHTNGPNPLRKSCSSGPGSFGSSRSNRLRDAVHVGRSQVHAQSVHTPWSSFAHPGMQNP